MTYHFIVKEEAVNDIEEAFTYYEKQVSGLGLRFIRQLDEHFEQIKEHPFNYSYFLNQQIFRSHSLKLFPFSIIYEVTETEIIVFAVHNHHQQPDNIFKRK